MSLSNILPADGQLRNNADEQLGGLCEDDCDAAQVLRAGLGAREAQHQGQGCSLEDLQPHSCLCESLSLQSSINQCMVP